MGSNDIRTCELQSSKPPISKQILHNFTDLGQSMVSKSTNQKPKISKSYEMSQTRKLIILIIVKIDVGDITDDKNGRIFCHHCSVTNYLYIMPILLPLSQNKNSNTVCTYSVVICIPPEVHSARIWRNIHDNYSLKGWKSNLDTITFKFNSSMKIFVSLGKHFGTTQKTKSHHIFNTTKNELVLDLVVKGNISWKHQK